MLPDFRSLAELLLPIDQKRQLMTRHDAPVEEEPMAIETYTSATLEVSHAADPPEERTLAEIERFRAAAISALEGALEGLLGAIADEVLARELALAPADIQTLFSRALRRFEREGPVRLRVAPQDVQQVQTSLPVIADANLMPGDFTLEVRDGEIESHLPVRLACAVHRLAQEANDTLLEEVLPFRRRELAV